MDTEKIGQFIKELRKEKSYSQEALANLIPIDRSVISKWERGDVLPPVDKMKTLCDIFGVSVDELIAGELNTKENEKEHQNKLFDYLIKQDYKYKKVKLFSLFSVIIIFILIFSFLTYYFLETHNTEKIYRIYGKSDNYELNNGFLVITREKSYLKIGSVNDKIYDIVLYYKDENEDKIIYSGNSDNILLDGYGYDAYINVKNLDSLNNNLYMRIGDEEIKLHLSKDYNNDNYILDDWEVVSTMEENETSKLEVDMDKIKKEFKCDEVSCFKEISKDMTINYSYDDNILYLKDKYFKIRYIVNDEKLLYESDKVFFDIVDEKINCTFGNCENYKEIYDKYYTNLIKNYLK